ncbi:MAG: hypothetical protein ABW127_18325 [Candidatus Thiodiazotropha endolucinida]
MTSLTEPGTDCGCSTGQSDSPIACPVCTKRGRTVDLVTPEHTLIKEVRDQLDPARNYHFCDNPDCDVVYYNDQDTSVFRTHEVKNRVTIKDDSPETPLCYCFKVFKKHALEEISRTGTTNVFQRIQAKMRPGQSCFCEKSNPRGDTCTQDIKDWLETQGITNHEAIPMTQSGSCCGNTGSGCTG